MSGPGAPGGTRVAGYASVFDVADKGRDVVRRGAFARAKAGVPLLWQHDPKRPIGHVVQIGEDARGLRVIASVTPGTAQGREALALLRAGAVSGLSFGYRVRQSARDARSGLRELTDLDLLEVSLVTFPMQPLARVHAVDPVPTISNVSKEGE